MMGEAIGVVLHIAIKYLKSSALRRSRKIGKTWVCLPFLEIK